MIKKFKVEKIPFCSDFCNTTTLQARQDHTLIFESIFHYEHGMLTRNLKRCLKYQQLEGKERRCYAFKYLLSLTNWRLTPTQQIFMRLYALHSKQNLEILDPFLPLKSCLQIKACKQFSKWLSSQLDFLCIAEHMKNSWWFKTMSHLNTTF